MRKFLKPFSFLPALLLMYMIYSFSAQEGEVSSAMSYQVSYTMVKAADKVLDAGLEDWEMQSLATRFNGVTRKIAHMTEYFALAIAVAFPLYVYGLHGFLLMLLAGLICVGFACGDEYHQSFVAGRGPSPRDVLIDSFGVFWGIVVVRIIGWTGRKTIFRPIRKKSRRDDSYYYEEDYGRRQRERRSRHSRDDEYYESSYERAPRREYYDDPYEYTPQREYDNSPYGRALRQEYDDSSYGRAPRQEYDDSPYDHTPRQEHYGTSGYSYYNNPYSKYRQDDYRGEYSHREVEDAHVSDKLAEDMSFKKLMHDIKEQRKEGKRSSQKYSND